MGKEDSKQAKKTPRKSGVKVSITAKILIMTLCILIASMVTTTVLITQRASKLLVERGEDNLANLSYAKGDTLETYISAQKQLTKSVATNASVVKAAQNYQGYVTLGKAPGEAPEETSEEVTEEAAGEASEPEVEAIPNADMNEEDAEADGTTTEVVDENSGFIMVDEESTEEVVEEAPLKLLTMN